MRYTKRSYFKTILLMLFHIVLIHASLCAQNQNTPNNPSPADTPSRDTGNRNAQNNGLSPTSKTAPSLSEGATAKPSNNIDSATVLWVNIKNTDPNKNIDSLPSAGLGDIIFIKVSHFNNLLQRSKDFTKNISLYINDRRIDNILPISGAPDKDNGTFQYKLDRNTSNDKIWADILGAPSLLNDDFFHKKVKISVGLENESAIKVDSNNFNEINFNLIRIHEGWFWACCIIVLLYLFIFISMVKRRGLLKDRGIDLSAIGITNNGSLNTYSLGRFQMAFWFTLIVISFFFIWLITDAYNIISTTVLALIGISAGTSLSAAVIDNNKSTDLLNQTIDLQNELATLNIEIPALQNLISNPPTGADVVNLQNQLNIKKARALAIPSLIAQNKVILTPQSSRGFLNDILTDANGISFHRLQMFIWTFILGLIFLYSVWKSLSMPEFDATLLALQGLTAGTYLGFKFPEKQT